MSIVEKRKEITKLNKEIEQLREKKQQEALEFDTLVNAKEQLTAAMTNIAKAGSPPTMAIVIFRK